MNASKLIVLFSLVLCACATGPKVKESWAVRRVAENPNDEVRLLHKDHSVAATVAHNQMQIIAAVANQITLTSGVGSAVYLVEMTDVATANAFAWTDNNGIGYIFITLPMARAIGSDSDQWAALLGHETGHLAKDHQNANASRQATLQGTATALGFIPLPIVGAIARAVVMPVAATAVSAHYSRDQEREADALSVKYMVAAGYDPQGAIRLQETLLAVGGGKGAGFFSSHPGGDERIKNIQTAIEQQPRRTGSASATQANPASAGDVEAAAARLRALERANAAEAASHVGMPGYTYETTNRPTPPGRQPAQATETERQFDLERARQSAEQDRLIRDSQ
jgi:predicted Zn-dependent protease